MAVARDMGFPVLIKASSGGGGKGMRIAHDEADVAKAFTMAQAEAARAFGNAEVYMEKYIESARHIEVQILADTHGHVIHLGRTRLQFAATPPKGLGRGAQSGPHAGHS